jgi:hypothetical protein
VLQYTNTNNIIKNTFNFYTRNFLKTKSAWFLVVAIFIFFGASINNAQALSFYRSLGLGSIGQDVKELQKFLNANGYVLANAGAGAPGRETTYFGPITRAALIKFQVANKITPAVGFFGPITRALFNKIVGNLAFGVQPVAEPSGSSQPVNQSSGQSGIIERSPRYAIGGMITGISGTIVLQNNNKDDWIISPKDNSIFTFPTALLNDQTYAVTVKSKPADHTCYISNGTGVVNHANVDNIKIACGTNLSYNPFTFTAGGGIVTYTLTYTAGANGSVTGTASQTVNFGANGSAVTAVAAANYHFVNWSDGSTANPRTDTSVIANKSVTANFAINTYTLTYTAGANGSLTGTSPQTVNHGANGSAVTAVANTHYSFVDWSDGSTANPRTDTNVVANKSVTANFTIDTFTITSSTGANGTIDPLGVTTKDYGSSQVYTITADGGYSISDIFVDSQSVGPAGSYEFLDIQANHTIEVQFSGGEV